MTVFKFDMRNAIKGIQKYERTDTRKNTKYKRWCECGDVKCCREDCDENCTLGE